MAELTDEQRAFLCGLIDAEGALQIQDTIRIYLAMTEYLEIFRWISKLFDKKIYIDHYNRKPLFRITLYGYDAYEFLLENKDYFVLKQDNAEILIKAYETKDFAFYKESLIPYTLKRGKINELRSFNIKIGGDLIGSYLHGLYLGDGYIGFSRIKNAFEGTFTSKYYYACKMFQEYCNFGGICYSKVWHWSWSGNRRYKRLLELGISKQLPSWLK